MEVQGRSSVDHRENLHALLMDLEADPDLLEATRNILKAGYKGLKFTCRLLTPGDMGTVPSSLENAADDTILICVCGPDTLPQLQDLLTADRRDAMALPTVVVMPVPDADRIMRLFDLGVADFIIPPLHGADFWPRLLRLMRFRRKNRTLEWQMKEKLGLRQIIGEDPGFREEVRKIPVAAESDAQVLITGETGTGKELFARAVHYLSPRAEKPFVPLNCGALPAELMENELFGHRKGAYTGAHAAEEGLVHQAEGGTLFLDDVDCLSQVAQTKLLRFLQEKEYRRLGSRKIRKSDVRIIAATNLDLEEAVRSGNLRSDLYYRLNVIPLHLPPLRDRQDDILVLARYFLRKYCREYGKQVHEFSPGTRRHLLLYRWPGNIRELQNVVKRAVLFTEGPVIYDLHTTVGPLEAERSVEPFNLAKAAVIEAFEKKYIRSLLRIHNGNITHAAEAARKHRRAFWELIRKHRIDVEQFKSEAPVS